MIADVETKHTTRQRQHAPHKEAGCVALISKHQLAISHFTCKKTLNARDAAFCFGQA